MLMILICRSIALVAALLLPSASVTGAPAQVATKEVCNFWADITQWALEQRLAWASMQETLRSVDTMNQPPAVKAFMRKTVLNIEEEVFSPWPGNEAEQGDYLKAFIGGLSTACLASIPNTP